MVIDNDEVVTVGHLELLHYILRGIAEVDDIEVGIGLHELGDFVAVVELGREDDLSHVVEDYDADELVVGVEDWEEVALGVFDGFDEVAEGVAYAYDDEVGLDEFAHVDELPGGGVFVVGEEIAVLGEVACVDGVLLDIAFLVLSTSNSSLRR